MRTGHVRVGQDRTGSARSDRDNTGQNSTVQVRTGHEVQVMSGGDGTGHEDRLCQDRTGREGKNMSVYVKPGQN